MRPGLLERLGEALDLGLSPLAVWQHCQSVADYYGHMPTVTATAQLAFEYMLAARGLANPFSDKSEV